VWAWRGDGVGWGLVSVVPPQLEPYPEPRPLRGAMVNVDSFGVCCNYWNYSNCL
jgi:hypothetical protein